MRPPSIGPVCMGYNRRQQPEKRQQPDNSQPVEDQIQTDWPNSHNPLVEMTLQY